MPIYKVDRNEFVKLQETTFAQEKLLERRDIQRLLCNDISVVSDDLMVIAEEFSDWEDSSRRIDILCLDKQARKVVVEVKRTEDGGHMELQAVRYAAMISAMTFDHVVKAHSRFLNDTSTENAKTAIHSFLGLSSTDESILDPDIRIILLAADFHPEVTTTVIWLRRNDIDIRCMRLKPYKLGSEVLLDVQQIIPPPETTDYEVKLRVQQQEERRALNLRQERLLRFWQQFIERSRPKSPLFANRSPTTDHWLSSGMGIKGFNINVVAMQSTSRVECYVDMGKDTGEQNVEILRNLQKVRDKIEKAFGHELDWQELDDSRGCRICKVYNGGWKSSENDWPTTHDELIIGAINLEGALKPRILELDI